MFASDEAWAARTAVRTSRLPSAGERALWRRRIEALDGAPAGLPPAAVLVARRLGVRASGEDRAALEAGWRDGLERLHRAAARPDSPGADAAEAILFRDEAEMYACLVADALAGRAGRRWWWATLLRRLGCPPEPSRLLAARPELLPAVLASLSRQGSAVAAAGALAAAEAARLLALVLEAHAAGPSRRALDEARRQASALVRTDAFVRDGGGAVRPAGADEPLEWPAAARLAADAGWRALPLENRLLLAVALTLAESPGEARSPSFAWRAAAWYAAQARRGLAGFMRPAKETRSDERAAAEGAPTRPAGIGQPLRGAPDAEQPFAPGDEARRGPRSRNRSATAGRLPPGPRGRAAARQSPEPGLGTAAAEPCRETAEADPAWGVATRLGGALYLISAFERLDLPECFEPEWPLAAHLGRWGTLELVCRGLLAAAGLGGDHADDPLWGVLGSLEGREPGVPAFGSFRARREFRLPAAWAPQLVAPGDALYWASRGGRVAVWSQPGVFLAVRRIAPGHSARETALAAARGLFPAADPERARWSEAPRAGVETLPIAASLRFWLGAALPALRAWLAQAMALGAPSYRELAETLLVVPGRLYAGPARVDLVAPLDEVRIAVRRAGLDIDPGYLPAWGRSIRFHYPADPGAGVPR